MGLFDFLHKREDTSITPPVNDVLLQALLSNEPITREKALTLPDVSGAVDFICNAVASMPVKLYKYKQGKVEEQENDSRVRILNGDTGDTLDAFQLKKAMVEDYLLGKGGYAYIQRSRNEVTALKYVRDEFISIMRNPDPLNKKFTIFVYDKEYKPFEFIKLLRNTKDGASGTGVIVEVSKALETAYRTLLYQLSLVKSGGNKKGFLKSTRKLGQDEINVLKAAWNKLYANSEENIVVLNNGLEFQESSNSSVEMQLNESKKTLRDEINNIFHISDNFDLTFKGAIFPIIKAFETALNRDMLLEKEKKNMFFEFDVKEIVRASQKERYEAYKTAKETGFITLNEIRRAENMEYIEGLDVVNVGLGAVLYDVNTHTYYTPNTGESTELTEEAVDANAENEENVTENIDQNLEGNIEQNLEDETYSGETAEGDSEEADTEIDDALNKLEIELDNGEEPEEKRYTSQYYDAAKAHEYYMKHKKATAKKKTMNAKGKAAVKYVKNKMQAEKKALLGKHKAEMLKKISDLKKLVNKGNKQQIAQEIKALKEEHNNAMKKINAEFEEKFKQEQSKISADAEMQTQEKTPKPKKTARPKKAAKPKKSPNPKKGVRK